MMTIRSNAIGGYHLHRLFQLDEMMQGCTGAPYGTDIWQYHDKQLQNGSFINGMFNCTSAVLTSAAEAELGALYINARKAVYIRQILKEMGHKQPPTPMQIDNSTAVGIVNNKILPKATNTMDMRFDWLRCRHTKKMFRFFWRPGPTNKGHIWTWPSDTSENALQVNTVTC